MSKWTDSLNRQAVDIANFYAAKNCLSQQEFAGRKIVEVVVWSQENCFFLRFSDGSLSKALKYQDLVFAEIPVAYFQSKRQEFQQRLNPDI